MRRGREEERERGGEGDRRSEKEEERERGEGERRGREERERGDRQLVSLTQANVNTATHKLLNATPCFFLLCFSLLPPPTPSLSPFIHLSLPPPSHPSFLSHLSLLTCASVSRLAALWVSPSARARVASPRSTPTRVWLSPQVCKTE